VNGLINASMSAHDTAPMSSTHCTMHVLFVLRSPWSPAGLMPIY